MNPYIFIRGFRRAYNRTGLETRGLLRLVFTSDGVGVGVIIRSVELMI